MDKWLHPLYKMLDEITYLSTNFNGLTVDVWECINKYIIYHSACDYLSMVGLKLNHISKRGRWAQCVDWRRSSVMKQQHMANGLASDSTKTFLY